MRIEWVSNARGLHVRSEEAKSFHLNVPVCETVSETACSEWIISWKWSVVKEKCNKGLRRIAKVCNCHWEA